MQSILNQNKQSFEIVLAASGEEGWEVFQKYSDQIKLVITDFRMKAMSGP
jgi:YesN/AraC family two-component response regulator